MPLNNAVELIRLLQDEAARQGLILIWTVYDKPSDCPEDIVARCFVVGRGDTGATNLAFKGKTLRGVRTALRMAGLTPLARQDDDEPQIVESWL